MARPSVGVAGHGLATCKGAAGCGQGPTTKGRPVVAKAPYTGGGRLRPAHRGGSRWWIQPLVARCPQGAIARSQGYRQQGQWRRPQGQTPLGRRLPMDKGIRRLRRGDGGDIVRVREEG
ncbi:hypothetical protein BHE74_00029666 [Ensete ventricosum]|nr:hypothetical protein BHE74_00029666 [Ensete ventricosum]